MAKKQHEQPIARFRLDDSTVYHWKIARKSLDNRSVWQDTVQRFVATLVKWLASTLIPAALIYAAFRWLEVKSLSLGFWAACTGTGLSLLLTVYGVFVSLFTLPHHQAKGRILSVGAAITSLGGVFYLLSAPESLFAQGFLGVENTELSVWLVFFFDNLVAVMFFDTPELVFGYRFSAISWHSQSSRAVVVLIRVLMVIGVIEMLMSLLRGRQKNQPTQQFFSSVQDCVWHYTDNFDRRREPLECLGKVAPFPEPIDLSVEEFITDFIEAWGRAPLKNDQIYSKGVVFMPQDLQQA